MRGFLRRRSGAPGGRRQQARRSAPSSPYERQARSAEALLLLWALLILGAGIALVLAAKQRDTPAENTVLLVNQATPEQLARALSVPLPIARRIVAERQQAGGFGDVDALGRLPLLRAADVLALQRAGLSPATATRQQITSALGAQTDAATVNRLVALQHEHDTASWEWLARQPLLSAAQRRAADERFVVRTWAEARRQLLLWCGLIAAFLIAAHGLLRRTRPTADPFLLPIAGLLSILGVLLLFSLKDPVRDLPSFAFQAQGIVIGGGLALLFALSRPISRLPLHRYGYLYAVAAIAATLLLGLLGSGPGGVRLSLAGTQPVEGIKVLLVFFLAAYLAERGPLLNDPLRKWGPFPAPRRRDVGPLLVLYSLPLVLFALVRDLGPVLLLFGAFLLLIYLATGHGAYIALGVLTLLGGAILGYAMHFGVFATRVDMWLSPWANGHRGGDQLALGLWGLASGGALGSGLGLGAPGFIPRGGSDLAFASLGEQFGLLGTAGVVAGFLVLAARGFRIARRASSDFERLLAAGLAGLLALQAGIIVCGVLGLLPLAGITLPFVAYGKSSLVASFFMVGMLLAISARPASAAVAPPRVYDRAAVRVVFLCAFAGLLIAGRLVWVQVLAMNAIAARTVRVPDADNVARPHINPRLLALADAIPRGRILDRVGRVLAETRNQERVYPAGAATGHLIGYLDPRVGGPTGLEARYDGQLRGFESWAALVPLWRRKDLPGFQLPRGEDITLALDVDLQRAARAALVEGTARVADRRTGRPKNRGAVVVLDVATGGILAAATSPTYDPRTLTPATLRALRANVAGDFPLINRALGGFYPPGSTFKIVTASALLSAGKADFVQTCRHVDTNVLWTAGGETYARRRIVDDEGERPHGLVNLSEGVAQSCNIYFAHAGIALGPEALRTEAAQFGFSHLPAAAQFRSELPDIAFGQGPVLASPLEMAGVAQTVASNGRRLRPVFLKSDRADVVATPLTPPDAARLAEMMRRVTRSGTAAGRFDTLPFSVAGKTGTAQNEEGDRMSHSWFIGFAPVENPKIAFAVIAENGGYGASVAVPIARNILRAANL